MKRKLKILAVVNDLGAVAQVRIISPLEYLKLNGDILYEVVDLSAGKNNNIDYVPDIVIIQRLSNIVFYDFIKFLKSKGSKIIFELDDNLLELPHQNPSFGFFSDPNVRRGILDYIWLADHLIVSTENLKTYFSPYNKSISVVPNQIDDEIFTNKKIRKTNASKIRIGFAGTVTHREDFLQVEEALKEVKAKYKDKIQLVFLNMMPKSFVYDQTVEYLPGVTTLDKFSQILLKANFDIGLAPLAFNRFNMGKSDIKFLEYGISGIAGVYSNFGPYKRTIENNETGLFVNLENPTGWISQLSYLIENPSEIDRIKTNAFNFVLEKRILKKNYTNWLNVFTQIKDGEFTSENDTSMKAKPLKKVEKEGNATKSKSESISIIIPVFNKIEFTKQCLDSIFAHATTTDFEIIVIDNGSTDGTNEYLEQQSTSKSNVSIVSNSQNLGFAKANNIGVAKAKNEYILFLNNDIVVSDNWLNPLLEILLNDESVGAVGGKLLYPDGSIQHAGIAIINNKKINDPLMGSHIYLKNSADIPDANILMEYQSLTGACLLMKKEIFNKVGGFDEEYWNGYEDIDLCFKLREKGLKLVYQPKSELIHYESQSGEERFVKVKENISILHKRWLSKIEVDFILEADGSMLSTNAKMIKRYNKPAKNLNNIRIINKISIVIPTFNQWNYTKQTIESIQKFTIDKYEIIIVDNASSDDTIEELKNYKDIKVISNKENLGFPKAVNQGILEANGNYILIANNDIVFTENWLPRMLEIVKQHPEIGIVGPISNSVSGRQFDKNAKYKSIPEMHKYAAKVRKENKGQFFEFPRVAFLCTLIKKEVIDKIGGLDERYSPGNFEDDDFCLRAQMAGYKTVIATDVFIHHYGSVSFKADGEDKYAKRLEINRKKFVEKWGADPEEIWIKGTKSKQREIKYSIDTDLFSQHIKRAFTNIDENEPFLAIENLEIATEHFKNSERKGYENLVLDELIVILGNLYFATNNLEKAKETFEAGLNENPNSSTACQGLGDIFQTIEEYEPAKMMFEWAVKNDESNKTALQKLTTLNKSLGLDENDFSLSEE